MARIASAYNLLSCLPETSWEPGVQQPLRGASQTRAGCGLSAERVWRSQRAFVFAGFSTWLVRGSIYARSLSPPSERGARMLGTEAGFSGKFWPKPAPEACFEPPRASASRALLRALVPSKLLRPPPFSRVQALIWTLLRLDAPGHDRVTALPRVFPRVCGCAGFDPLDDTKH